MYDAFIGEIQKISNIGYASAILSWDQEVMMPEGGTAARAQQLSTLSSLSHELLTSDRMATWLEEVEPRDPGQEAVVREVRRSHERAVTVPDSLVREISSATSNAFPVWREAKEESDFAAFAPTLERLLDLKRRYAEHIDPDRDPYAVLFEDYEPYVELDTAETLLRELREGIAPLVDAIASSGVEIGNPVGGNHSVETQRRLVRETLERMGFDFSRGRLDESPHPFSTGNQFDARITTRFGDDPLDGLTSTVHEMGHALYTLGLPEEHYGTPLGQSRELTVHESQSRIWENHVGRSREFWTFLAPVLNDALGTDAAPEALYRHANRVGPHPIRVESDELTYHMHIVLRFEIESALVRGDLGVDEVPGAWNDRMERYLGIRPGSDAEGALQDIHWSHGSFGYFPTYSLGSLLSAQLFDAADRELTDLRGDISAGEFSSLREWLRERVHRHGQRYTTPELVERATGSPLSVAPFLSYAERKFGDIYGL